MIIPPWMAVYDCKGKELEVGQACKVVNGNRPESKTGYYVIIQPLNPSYSGCDTRLQTYIPGRHSAALHSYWSRNLKIVGDEKSHGHLLLNQTI